MIKPEDYHTINFIRMFFGNFPVSIYLEAVIRTIIMYCYTVFITRTIGKRVKNEISFPEMMIIIVFGPIGGTPMFDPDIPVLLGIILITLVIALELIFSKIIKHSNKAFEIFEGKTSLVIDNGVIDINTLDKYNFSNLELLMQLRKKNISNLG